MHDAASQSARPRLSFLRTLHALALLMGIVATAFWLMDGLTEPAPPSAPAAAPAVDRPWHPGPPRMFILVVDSLRYENALDPSLMPHLVTMRERGTYARMLPTHDAISVSALRAAFTGMDRVSVFGFVRNLWHGEEGFESLFTQLRKDGRSAATYSDGSFMQFNRDIAERRPNGVGIQGQGRTLERALASYLAGEHDVVVMHITYSDAVAHSTGIHAEEYRRAFGIVDGLIERLDEAIPDDETFMIMGDHGHDELGRHQMGMDVPTYTLYRGPAFRPGHDLGVIPIMDTRYFVNFVLELPLPADYPSGRHPDALVTDTPLPGGFDGAFDALTDRGAQATGVPRERRGRFALAMLGLALLVSLWLAGARSALGAGGLHIGGSWLTLVLLASSATWPVAAAFACAAGVATLAALGRRLGARRAAAWVVLPALAALGFVGWGYLLSSIRAWVHWPPYVALVAGWVPAYALGVVIAWRRDAVRAAWILLAVVGVLAYPSVYRYGAPATMVPLWFALLLFVVVQRLRDARNAGGTIAGAVRRPAPHDVLLPAIVVLLAPFAFAYAEQFRFVSWFGPIAWTFFGNRHMPEVPLAGWVLVFVARLVIFVRRRDGAVGWIAGVAAAALVQVAQARWVSFTPAESPRFQWMAAIIGLAVAALLLRRLAEHRTARALARITALLALYAAWYYLVRVPFKGYLWADCLIAALLLTGRFVVRDPATRDRPSVYAWLLIMGVVVAGWSTLAWTFHRLEWGFAFDWFDVRLVERNVGWFAFAIAFRFVLPLVIIRLLLAEAVAGRWPYPRETVLLIAGAKALSVMMIACGMGDHRVESDVYLEAVQQSAIWVFLVVALPWTLRRPLSAVRYPLSARRAVHGDR